MLFGQAFTANNGQGQLGGERKGTGNTIKN